MTRRKQIRHWSQVLFVIMFRSTRIMTWIFSTTQELQYKSLRLTLHDKMICTSWSPSIISQNFTAPISTVLNHTQQKKKLLSRSWATAAGVWRCLLQWFKSWLDIRALLLKWPKRTLADRCIGYNWLEFCLLYCCSVLKTRHAFSRSKKNPFKYRSVLPTSSVWIAFADSLW